jgi:hypothetical protein
MSTRTLLATTSTGLVCLLALGCVPTVDEDPSLAIDGQILAVQFEPAEAEPEGTSAASALVAGVSGANAGVSFDLCLARKALSDLGPVSPACFAPQSEEKDVLHLGRGEAVAFDVPEDACRLFGPQRPSAEPGQPPGRAVDPDATGGYYQPVVARLEDTVLGALRLDCGLPGASQAQVAEYNKSHTPNQNPVAESLEVRIDGGKWQTLLLGEESAVQIPRNASVTFRSKWSAPERYLLVSSERELTKPTEEYLATFYSSVGRFTQHRKLVEGRTVNAKWQAPENPELVTVWLVVRDGRGGTGWTSFEVTVN